jgi:hypothetical protein
MEFDDDISDQPPKLIDDDMLYCEHGTLLALNFLRVSHMVVEHAGVIYTDDLRKALNNALDTLLTHRATCDKCNER